MVTRKVIVRAADVVLLKAIVEAHDGVAHVFGEHGGELLIAAPSSRERELDAIVSDLCAEIGAACGGSSGT